MDNIKEKYNNWQEIKEFEEREKHLIEIDIILVEKFYWTIKEICTKYNYSDKQKKELTKRLNDRKRKIKT